MFNFQRWSPPLFSLIFHLLLLIGIYLMGGRREPIHRGNPEPMVVVIEDGLRPRGGNVQKNPRPVPSVPAQLPKEKKVDLGLAQKPSFENSPQGPREARNIFSEEEGNGAEGGPGGHTKGNRKDAYDLANGMTIEKEAESYPFYEAVWRRANALMTYPKDFAEQRIQGKVAVQLSVDRRGVFTGTVKSIHGSEPMLNTLVLATLIHALRHPLPEKSWLKKEESAAADLILLVFQIEFKLLGPAESPKPLEFAHFKNILNLRRESYVEPKLNQEIERFFTRYMPPVIILPGMFYIDFVRTYHLIRNYASPSIDPNDLRTQRLEMKKEEWENLIEKKKNGDEAKVEEHP